MDQYIVPRNMGYFYSFSSHFYLSFTQSNREVEGHASPVEIHFSPAVEKTHLTRNIDNNIDANKINEVKKSNCGGIIIKRIETFSPG